MPTYGPDGTIRLDTEVSASNSPTMHGPSDSAGAGFSDATFRDSYEALEGVKADRGYEHYDPHFRYGWESAGRHRGRKFDEAEPDLERDWRSRHADRDWREYRSAVRHAFDRAMHVFEGAPDPDRRT